MRLPYKCLIFVERESIWPIFEPLDEFGANRIFFNVQPFLPERLIGSEQPIETSGLPLPIELAIS